jgi:hypothetical protein
VFTQKRGPLPGVRLGDPNPARKIVMPRNSTPGTFEECADELNDFINTLQRYPPTVLAFVLRAHLAALLQALLLYDAWTPEEVAGFLADTQRDVLPPEAD